MKFSKYQTNFFDVVAQSVQQRRRRLPFRHVVVEASAGAAKTTSLVEFCRLNPDVRAVVVAFGRKNADELKQRLPSNAEASTLHSLGLRAWTTTLGGWRYKPEVAFDKIDRIIRPEVEAGRIPRYWRGKVRHLVDLARMHGIVPGSRCEAREDADACAGSLGVATPPTAQSEALSVGTAAVNDVVSMRGLLPDDDVEWELLMQRFDVYTSGQPPAAIIRMARDVLAKSIRYGHRIVDFTDMLYLPTLAEGAVWRVDVEVVAVDELQDLDVLQRCMVLGLVRSGCVFVGVGDPQQGIFGWRGADADSMAKIIRATDAVVLPLPICYRCPTSHLDMARQYSPAIEAREGADEGLLERYDEKGDFCCPAPHLHGLDCICARVDYNPATWHEVKSRRLAAADFQPGDVVLCRAKAPLVKAAYWLLRHRVPARVLGRDIADGILAFVDSMRATDVPSLLRAVERYTDRAVARAAELDDDTAIEEAVDRREVIKVVADDYEGDDVDGLKTRLQSLFGDGDDRDRVVTLSTIHRMKGGEADRVWWLDYRRPDPTNPKIKHEWQRKEARHLRFVALTRSRRELRLTESSSLK